MRTHWVTVNDRMQQGYRYARTARVGRDFDPAFKPELTPAQMLRLGVFGGRYMTTDGVSFLRAGSRTPSSPRAGAGAMPS